MNVNDQWETLNRILSIQELNALEQTCEQLILENREIFGEILLKIIQLGEPFQVTIASKLMGIHGDAALLTRLQNIRSQLPLRCGMRDYREDVDQAIAQLIGKKSFEW